MADQKYASREDQNAVEGSRFLFCRVAAKRSRQLYGGAPGLSLASKIQGARGGRKPTAVAMEEVRRGLVIYEKNIPDELV